MAVTYKDGNGYTTSDEPPHGSNARRVLYGDHNFDCTSSNGHLPQWHHFDAEPGVPARVCKHCLAEQHAIPIDGSTRREWVAI